LILIYFYSQNDNNILTISYLCKFSITFPGLQLLPLLFGVSINCHLGGATQVFPFLAYNGEMLR
ncbi:MAG: hypothetical protein Q8877_03335, partial [Sweet potato little leaf phytoplasma]|nr:hypothetical protein [Sweet potato little leaf phytoplasma]